MESYIPLFPLNLVPFPREVLNLHIFEPRYKQLMQDVLEGDRRFGIPAYIHDKIEFGTEVEVLKVVRTYPDGRMDIRTEGVRAFRALDYHNPMEGKLYAGGKVEFCETIDDGLIDLGIELRKLVTQLFHAMKMDDRIHLPQELETFDIAHKVGLDVEEKYILLQMSRESDRQIYLINHLKRALPLLRGVEQSKERIRMNGHFRHFDPLNF